jgi:putative hydrolase of the HAD superfamily
MIRAVLFDLYDTLAWLDSSVIREGRAALAELAGADPDAWAAAWRASAVDRMLGRLGDLEAEMAWLLGHAGVTPPNGLAASMAEREAATWRAAGRLYADSLATLDSLKSRGFRLALVSNCSVQAGEVAHHLGVARRMDALSMSYQLGVAKPDPAIFLHACETIGVAPAECMFVADGAFTELDAATALGMTAVKVEQPNQSGSYGSSTTYAHRVSGVGEVLALLA